MIDFFTPLPENGTLFTPCRACVMVCLVILYTMAVMP